MPLEQSTAPQKDGKHERLTSQLLSVLCVACYTFYFLHLRADFPSHSGWNDWSKFTDEGWYGGAAMRHLQTGQWYAPGAFNPAVGLPAWPLVLRFWFGITGAGMAAARSLSVLLYGASLLLLFLLLKPHTGRLIAISAVLLTLLNPFCFAFGRLAILEPLVVFLFMLSLWMATPPAGPQQYLLTTQSIGRALAAGLLLCALALTKTTALALAPAVLYQLWATAALTAALRAGHGGTPASLSLTHPHTRKALILPAIAALIAATLWLAWFFIFVRPRYLVDFHELFLINHGHAHGRILAKVIAQALLYGAWINPTLFTMALLFIAGSLRPLRSLWRTPLFASAVLALLAYLGLIGWHTWFQPRYYLVCVLPMAIVLALGTQALKSRGTIGPVSDRWAYRAARIAFAIAGLQMTVQAAKFLLHPRYTFLGAANSIAQTVRSDPAHPRNLLSSSADNIALFTGLAPLNPEYPTRELTELVHRQRPGWYAASLPFEAREVARLQQIVPLQEAAHYSIFDDPQRNRLVLYRLEGPATH